LLHSRPCPLSPRKHWYCQSVFVIKGPKYRISQVIYTCCKQNHTGKKMPLQQTIGSAEELGNRYSPGLIMEFYRQSGKGTQSKRTVNSKMRYPVMNIPTLVNNFFMRRTFVKVSHIIHLLPFIFLILTLYQCPPGLPALIHFRRSSINIHTKTKVIVPMTSHVKNIRVQNDTAPSPVGFNS